MTHQNAGHYKKKHPEGTKLDPEMEKALQKKVKDGCVTCAQAHDIATEHNTSPQIVGISIDLLELRLTKCQLGLFGYKPEKKIVSPAEKIDQGLADAITKKQNSGKISCEDTWKISTRLVVHKMEVSAACETLKIKVSPCQLGAF